METSGKISWDLKQPKEDIRVGNENKRKMRQIIIITFVCGSDIYL